VGRLPQLVILPFVPQLMKVVRCPVIAGAAFCSFSSCLSTPFSRPISRMDQFRFSNIVRRGQPLIFVPLLSMSTENLPRKRSRIRLGPVQHDGNIGGSVGIATLSTILTQREHLIRAYRGTGHRLYARLCRSGLDSLSTTFQDKASTRPRPATTR